MKKVTVLLIFAAVMLASCKKNEEVSERFRLLTSHTWTSDSLLVDGIDASGSLLANFNGDAKFNADHSGTFGTYSGTWQFEANETRLTITSQALTSVIIAEIKELTEVSLKITTVFPNLLNPSQPLSIRMTFKPK